MGEPRSVLPPAPRRWPAWAYAASIALHLAALLAVMESLAPRQLATRRHLLVALEYREQAAPRSVPVPRGAAPPATPAAQTTPPRPGPTISPSADTAAVAQVPLRPFAPALDTLAAWDLPTTSTPLALPSLGSGVLWDRRPPAPVLLHRTHAELTDSTVKAMIHHYLDSIAALPGGGRILPPSWKATIGGQEFGLDGNFITVAGIKIPALVLGLIPLPAGGNESEALNKGAWMRAQDYELTLPRQAAAADQREQAAAIRARMEAERELNRRQQGSP